MSWALSHSTVGAVVASIDIQLTDRRLSSAIRSASRTYTFLLPYRLVGTCSRRSRARMPSTDTFAIRAASTMSTSITSSATTAVLRSEKSPSPSTACPHSLFAGTLHFLLPGAFHFLVCRHRAHCSPALPGDLCLPAPWGFLSTPCPPASRAFLCPLSPGTPGFRWPL